MFKNLLQCAESGSFALSKGSNFNFLAKDRVGYRLRELKLWQGDKNSKNAKNSPLNTLFSVLAIILLFPLITPAYAYTNNDLANAIYKAEGGAKTNHPYGILTKYKHTTPRQACLNTIKNQKIRHSKHNCGKDFLTCLRDRYCPIGCNNDNGKNKHWLANVRYFLNTEVKHDEKL